MNIRRAKWLLMMSLILLPVAFAQDDSSPVTGGSQQQHEDARAKRTREFLGLGRLPDAKMAAEGQKTFSANCSFCHGANARGGSGPDLLRSPVVLDDTQAELIGPTVHDGRPGKGMPAFPSLTSEQLHQIAEYLHLQIELAANRGTYQMLDVVTGNAKAGEAFFNGSGKCATCHSATGDLAHIGAKTKPADLQQSFLYPDHPATVKVTVTLPNGAPLHGTLKHLDDFYVSFYDTAGIYHSVPLQKGVSVQVEDKLAFHREMLDKYTNQQMHDLTAYLVTLK